MFSERKIIRILAVIIILLLVGAFALYNYSAHNVKPSITGFRVDKAQGFVVTARRLARAEVWMIPIGTDIRESDHSLLTALILNGHDTDSQTWVAAIPQVPVTATKIYAVGYNDQNQEVGRIALPYTGATDIFNAIWGTNSQLEQASTTGIKNK